MSALTSGEDLKGLLDAAVAQIPEGTNPYGVLRLRLLQTLTPKPLSPMRPLLLTVSALACIPPLVLIVSLIVRWRNGSLWLFRLHRTSDGSRYILPHYLSSWSLFLLILFGVLQGDIWCALGYGDGMKRTYWMLLIWIPGFTALCFATWTLACAYVIHVKAFSSRSSWRWYYSPYLLNTLGIFVPIAHSVTVIVLSILTSKHFRLGLENYAELDATFARLQRDWAGEAVTYAALRGMGPYGLAFLKHWRLFTHWFKTTCWFYGATGLGIGAVLVFVAIAYIRALRRHSVITTASTTVKPARRNDLNDTRWWLTAVTCAFALVFTALVANFLWVAALGDKPFTSSKVSLIANILPFYLLTLSCIPVSLILLVRALHDPAHHHPSNSSRSRSRTTNKYDHELSTYTPSAPLHHILALPHSTTTLGRSASPQGWHPFSRPQTAKSDDDRDEKDLPAAHHHHHHHTSGAFENLQLQVSINDGSTDLPAFGTELDMEVSSIGKDGHGSSLKEDGLGGKDVEVLDSPVAHPDPQALSKVLTRESVSEGRENSSSKKKKRSQVGGGGGRGTANGLEGVQVSREAVTVVSMADEVEETEFEAELRRKRELYAKTPW